MTAMEDRVHEYWNKKSCGEELYLSAQNKEAFSHQLNVRYQLEPFISSFAEFAKTRGKKVLEISLPSHKISVLCSSLGESLFC